MSPNVHRERQRRPKTSQQERICSVCSQYFKKAEHLARHIRSHAKERPFTCDVCGKFYARQDTLLRHSRSHRGHAHPKGRISEDHGSAVGQSPFDPPNEHRGSLAQQSDIEGPATSAPEHEHMALDLPSPPNQNLQTELTASMLDASTGDLHVQQNNQPTNDNHGIAMPQWPSTNINDIIPGETSPWSIIPDQQGDLDWMSWLTGPDFDLDALNQSLVETTEIQIRDPVRNPEEARGPIQRRWHTFSESLVSPGQTTPDFRRPGSSDRCQIHMIADESYRQKLAESLHQRVQPGILPSTGFLEFCLQAYFKHFQSIFPLIHVPTFRPSKKNALLLLSICSIGSLFLGSSRAMAHGISMFERQQKSILASWDTHVGTRDSSVIPLQASVIGQTFGLLVGRPKDLTGIEVFHGSIVAWARNAKLFKVVDEPTNTINIEESSEELEAGWKAWARMEEKKRIILGIYIHDVELVKLHHHEPLLRHSIEKIPRLSPQSVFTAPSAAAWKKQLLVTQTPVPIPPSPPHTDPMSLLAETKPGSDFESYAILELIGSLALEDRGSTAASPSTVAKCQRLLIQWHLQRHNHSPESDPQSVINADPFCLRILWHSTFMHLYTRFDDLECACGREGEAQSQQKRAYARSWARSVDAKRTLLHAALIQKQFQSLALGTEPAIHVPMALYYVGIAWASFTQFGGANDARIEHGTDDLDFPELRLLGVNQMQLFGEMMGGIQMGRPESGPLFRAIDLLGKMNHWKVSQNLSSTLLAFVENVPDLF